MHTTEKDLVSTTLFAQLLWTSAMSHSFISVEVQVEVIVAGVGDATAKNPSVVLSTLVTTTEVVFTTYFPLPAPSSSARVALFALLCKRLVACARSEIIITVLAFLCWSALQATSMSMLCSAGSSCKSAVAGDAAAHNGSRVCSLPIASTEVVFKLHEKNVVVVVVVYFLKKLKDASRSLQFPLFSCA